MVRFMFRFLTSGLVILVELPDMATISLAFLCFSLALKGLTLTATFTFSSSAILIDLGSLQLYKTNIMKVEYPECMCG